MKSVEIIKNITSLGFVQNFLKTFPKGNIYLVGGCIRDALLGIESSDFDFVVENINDQELIDFLEKEGKVVNVYGRTFGVIKFKPHSSEIVYDIALPRQEMYVPGQRRKHAQVELQNITIFDDLARRDFTINAMAIDLRLVIAISRSEEAISLNGLPQAGKPVFAMTTLKKCLIDPYNGLKDLEDKIIRTVGDPRERFKEDPTRILRGVRFAGQFGFKIEKETFLAMKELAPEILAKYSDKEGYELQRVSFEMIGTEFTKSLQFNAIATIKLYDQIGLLKLILPELEDTKGIDQPPQFHSEGDVYMHTLLALSKLSKDITLPVILATLFHDVGKAKTFKSAKETGDRIRFNNHDETGAEMAKVICHRFCFSNETTDRIVWMIKNHIKIFHSFFEMRLEKQKAFVRYPYFDNLLLLAQADTQASIFPTGKPDLTSYLKILQIADKIKKEDKTKPVEIINGKEIIAIFKLKNHDYDPKKHGKFIGDLKKRVNTLYDRNKIKTKTEALQYLKDFVLGKKYAQKGKKDKT